MDVASTPVPPAGREPDGLSLFKLGPRLTRLENAILRHVDPPLTFRQYRLMRRVLDGQSTITDIGREATLSLPAISESMDGLVRKGLIARTTDVRDRRSARLTVTDAGVRALRDGTARLETLSDRLLEGLDAAAARELREHIGTLTERVTALLREVR